MTLETKFIRLNDGRKLAYTEHGDLTGSPVFFVHGNPGSRLTRHPDESIAKNMGARLITPDRPGYGLSDFQPKRTLLDFPDDIAQLANALEIEEFAIFGVSAGGPYVAACAHKLSERITQAAIVSGLAPLNRPNAYEGMGKAWRTAFKISALPKWLLRPLLAIQTSSQKRDPKKAVDEMAKILAPSDGELLQHPAFRDGVKARIPEATRNGTHGWAHEVKVLLAPWGFSLSDVQTPIHLWYWDDDPAVPPQMGRYLASKLPNTTPHFLEGGGHLSIFVYWEEIIQNLLA